MLVLVVLLNVIVLPLRGPDAILFGSLLLESSGTVLTVLPSVSKVRSVSIIEQ